MEGSTGAKRATVGFVLSLIGGIFILINGIAWFALSSIFDQLGLGSMLNFVGLTLDILGGVMVVFAILVFIGAWLIYTPGKEMIGGILALIFSIISFIGGGGFALGAILGLIGGILGLLKK
ncbi:MAG: hypothetical protein QXM22_03170 [Candidatus Bathyarchaeia archaeon]